MAREIKISGSILNIALHPHPEGIYLQFFKKLFDLKQPVKLRGNSYGMISLLNERDVRDGVLRGKITTFTRIDPRGSWFDSETLSEASHEKTREIVIPKGIFPNAKVFNYIFDLREHRLYFQTYSAGDVLTPKSALEMFQQLSQDLKVTKVFGEAKISIVQSRRAVETLLSLPVLKLVEITILRPNPDILADDFEARIADEMAAANARKVQLTFEAEAGQSLQRTDDMQLAANVAAESGSLRVKGRDATGAVDQSTSQFPAVLQEKYDPMQEDEATVFDRLTQARRHRIQ